RQRTRTHHLPGPLWGKEPARSEAKVEEYDTLNPGATIEWQMTGADSWGGIQLQIIPEHDLKRIWAGNCKDIIGGNGTPNALTGLLVPGGLRREPNIESYNKDFQKSS